MHHESEHMHSGSSFDDFLKEEGSQNEVIGAASRGVIAWQREQETAYTRASRKSPAAPARKTTHA